MPTVQPPFDISNEMLLEVMTGKLNITGAVVRDATGQIVKHLEPAATKSIVESTQPVVEAATSIAKEATTSIAKETSKSLGQKFAVGTLIVAGLAAAGYGTYKLVTYLKKQAVKKDLSQSKVVSDEIITFNPELTEYLNRMQNQSMTLDSIKNVVSFFENYNNNNLPIEVTDDEMKVLRNIIVRYTIKLCELNQISLDDKKLVLEAESTNKDDLIYEILYATNIQQGLFA